MGNEPKGGLVGPAFSNTYCIWCDNRRNPEKYLYLRDPLAAWVWHSLNCGEAALSALAQELGIEA